MNFQEAHLIASIQTLLGHDEELTYFFFQDKYCQCKKNHDSDLNLFNRPVALNKENRICLNCGKSRPLEQKDGSFTGFLFKELRCHCQNPRHSE